MTVHTGVKAHQCKVCEKLFRLKGDLNKHMVVHTGEKPYSCVYCGRSYTDPSTLRKHKKRCKGQSSSQQYEAALTSKVRYETDIHGEEEIDIPVVYKIVTTWE